VVRRGDKQCRPGLTKRATCTICDHEDDLAERDAHIARLRALNAELVAMVERYASECAKCDGQGNSKLSAMHPEECRACADLRALIARAKGEA